MVIFGFVVAGCGLVASLIEQKCTADSKTTFAANAVQLSPLGEFIQVQDFSNGRLRVRTYRAKDSVITLQTEWYY